MTLLLLTGLPVFASAQAGEICVINFNRDQGITMVLRGTPEYLASIGAITIEGNGSYSFSYGGEVVDCSAVPGDAVDPTLTPDYIQRLEAGFRSEVTVCCIGETLTVVAPELREYGMTVNMEHPASGNPWSERWRHSAYIDWSTAPEGLIRGACAEATDPAPTDPTNPVDPAPTDPVDPLANAFEITSAERVCVTHSPVVSWSGANIAKLELVVTNTSDSWTSGYFEVEAAAGTYTGTADQQFDKMGLTATYADGGTTAILIDVAACSEEGIQSPPVNTPGTTPVDPPAAPAPVPGTSGSGSTGSGSSGSGSAGSGSGSSGSAVTFLPSTGAGQAGEGAVWAAIAAALLAAVGGSRVRRVA